MNYDSFIERLREKICELCPLRTTCTKDEACNCPSIGEIEDAYEEIKKELKHEKI